jgi:hypothetical protein
MGIPFLLAFLPDTILSIFSQSTIIDGFLFRGLARFHPQAVLLGYLAWAVAILALLVLLPEWLALILTISTVFGHIAGAYGQLIGTLGNLWYQAANGLFLAAAIALGVGLTWSVRAASMDQSSTTLSTGLRSALIVVFAIVAWSAIGHP